jgi:arabinoxylan arabinofuranohydrolase
MSKAIRVLLSLSSASTMLLLAGTSRADNPIIQTKYTADPAPLVYQDTVYLYTSHDEDDAVSFKMYNWMLYTSTDMANWTDHGIVAGVAAPYNTFPWAAGNNAWAPQAVEKDGKFYLYVPLAGRGGGMTIGVAVADSPFGPFEDPLGKELVSSGTSDDIDPTVFIDDDGQAYLFWGNPNCYYVKLNADMISYSGSVVKLPKIQTYQEGPWFYKRENNYYLAFASTCCPEGIGYAMSSDPAGPWTYKGSIMDGNSQSSGNHPGIIDYKGSSYVFGFNYNVQLQRENQRIGERRSICVEKMSYNPDGTIPKLPFWSKTGPEQIEPLNPFAQTEAETIAWAWDVKTETCNEGGMDVTAIENGDFIKVKGVDFRSGATSFQARVASQGSGGKIEIRLDSETGTLVGTCTVAGTGGAQTWNTVSSDVSGATEVHDIFFVFTGGSGALFNFNWWKFDGPGDPGNGTGGAGGAAGSGGNGPTGGSADTGGGGGAAPSGGTGPAGGTVTTGGRSGRGGATAGGGAATGGTVSSGGSLPAGGAAPATGGSLSTGGVTTATDGTASPAGGTPSGGSPSATGGLSTSGSTALGGMPASGGVLAAGGAPSAGADAGPSGTDASSDRGGCGCRVTGGRAGAGPLGILGLLVGLALRSRRRRTVMA